MARARAAVVLALAVCCLLAATAPARRPVDLQPARAADAVALVDRATAAEPLPRPVRAAADCADEQSTNALAVPVPEEEDGDAGRVEATSGGGASALEVRPSSKETTTTVEQGWGPAVSGKAEDDERRRHYDSDSDSDWDSDSDDEDEGGVFGWLWRLADRLF